MNTEQLEKIIGKRPLRPDGHDDSHDWICYHENLLRWECTVKDFETTRAYHWRSFARSLWFSSHPLPTEEEWQDIVKDTDNIIMKAIENKPPEKT